jgi:membrane associated rhomboid family serine protease
MNMSFAVYASNGATVTSSMVCCVAYLYKYRWRDLKARPLVATTVLIALTVLMFGLQLAYPEMIGALGRDLGALKRGEVWRLVTPLFVQSRGTGQFLFNMLFLVVFLPMAERLYGAIVWALYFVPGVVGQLVNYVWDPHGGGSSTAIFGVMGSLLMYVWLRRREAPKQYGWFALAGMCGAVVMCFTRDGHGPSLLTGAALAAVILWSLNEELMRKATEHAISAG